MDIIRIDMKRHQTEVTTHEIIREYPPGINKEGEKGVKIVKYMTTLLTPNNVNPVYWVNDIETVWLSEW